MFSSRERIRRRGEIGRKDATLRWYLKERAAVINETMPCHVGMHAVVFWSDDTATEFFLLEEPEYVLQEALAGGISSEVSDFGKLCKTISGGKSPTSITISTEAVAAFETGFQNHCRVVRGIPVLLAASKRQDEPTVFEIDPLATDKYGRRILPDSRLVPLEISNKIADSKQAKDFLLPFFDNFKSGGETDHKFSML